MNEKDAQVLIRLSADTASKLLSALWSVAQESDLSAQQSDAFHGLIEELECAISARNLDAEAKLWSDKFKMESESRDDELSGFPRLRFVG